MFKLLPVLLAAAMGLAACGKTDTVTLSSNTSKIAATGSVFCGDKGITQFAIRRAAVETLRRGFDNFVLLDTRHARKKEFIGYSSGTVEVVKNPLTGGYDTIETPGGGPMYVNLLDHQVVVRMFRAAEAAPKEALSARRVLGPDWQNEIRQAQDDRRLC